MKRNKRRPFEQWAKDLENICVCVPKVDVTASVNPICPFHGNKETREKHLEKVKENWDK